MSGQLSDRQREKARLIRLLDLVGRLDGDLWLIEAADREVTVIATRSTGETVKICTVHAHALPDEIELITSALDINRFFATMLNRAAQAISKLRGGAENKPATARAVNHGGTAAYLCTLRSFQRFLETRGAGGPVRDAGAANTRMKFLLEIDSKAKLNTDKSALARFRSLRADYDLWMKGGST